METMVINWWLLCVACLLLGLTSIYLKEVPELIRFAILFALAFVMTDDIFMLT